MRVILLLLLLCVNVVAKEPLDCSWDDDPPCVLIPITNSNVIGDNATPTYKIDKQTIQKHNLIDLPSVLNFVQGMDVSQSGPTGQQASMFLRGTNSNHTLVLMNGMPINDFSTPTAQFDFGQDFMSNVQMIEVYKGSAGAHYGADAIGGAVNFVTHVDYEKRISIDSENMSGNYYVRTPNDWDISVSGGVHESETQSALAGDPETDKVENQSIGVNISKWYDYNFHFKTSLFARNTWAEIDGHSLGTYEDKWSDNDFFAIQTGFDYLTRYGTSSLTLHTHEYDRDYDDANYDSQSYMIRAEHSKKNYGFGFDYKHDDSYGKSTWSEHKGRHHNLGLFGNFSYDMFSYHHRIDEDHSTYKIGFFKPVNDLFSLRGSHSTGYKNKTQWSDTEYSDTNEIGFDYNTLTTTVFQSNIGNLDTSGLELGYNVKNVKLFASHLTSKKNGVDQLRRPELNLGLLHTFENKDGVNFTTNYKYKGKHWDIHNSNWSTIAMPETHLLDLTVSKNFWGFDLGFTVNNLLDEQYQSPHGFSQDGRNLKLQLSSSF